MAVTESTSKGTDYAPSAKEAELCDVVHNYWTQSDKYLSKRHELWRRAYRLVHNRTWSQGRPSDVSTASASEIYPILAALVGWMTDQGTRFEVIPATNPHSQYFEQISKMGTDLETCIDNAYVNGLWDGEVEKVLWDAFIYGTGFFKTYWDPGAADGAGDAVLKRTDPFRMFVDPKATSFDDAMYIIEAREMHMDEIDRRFPDTAYKLRGNVNKGGGLLPRREDPFTDNQRMPMANPDAIRRDLGGDPVSGGAPSYGLPGQGRNRVGNDYYYDASVNVYECWMKVNTAYASEEEGEEPKLVPEWRVVIVAENVVLMDTMARELWSHGRHPYSRFVMQDIGDFWGISLVDHLAQPQLSLNRLLVALQQHAELTSNPVLLEDTRSGIPRTKIVNKPGQRVSKAAGSEVAWLVPPSMPADVQNLVTFWINEMERISGLSAIVRGATPGGRNSQGVLDSVQESAFVRIRLALRNLERCMKEIGESGGALIVQNYTLPRAIYTVGPEGQQSMLQLKMEHFTTPPGSGGGPLKFAMNVSAGSKFPISRNARADEADMLFAMGALDTQGVLEAHEYPNRIQIMERLNAGLALGVEGDQKGTRQRAQNGPGGSRG